MREIALFCEDSFHEKLVSALLRRIARDSQVTIRNRTFSARGGLGRMQGEFRTFLRDVDRVRATMPDAIFVVADANCLGYNERKRLFFDVVAQYPKFAGVVEYAIPDPHVERWMLLDQIAFRHVFERGCTLPAIKCAKDEYKKLLRREIQESGIDAPLGGEEFAEEIVEVMDLDRMAIQEPSFGLFIRSVRAFINQWRDAGV